MPIATLDPVLDRLAGYESDSHPVVSLYLDLRPDQRGKDNYKPFLDGAFREQLDRLHESGSDARANLERDFEKIRRYLENDVSPSTQALAIFSSSGDPELFEALQLEAPLDGHRLYIDRTPHLFPLARLADQYGSYAALIVNTNSARLFVFDAGAVQRQLTIKSEKGKRVAGRGWSQARYQRHVENLHLKHMKEVAEAVERVVRENRINRILVAGDEVALPLLREQLSPETSDRLIEVGRLDAKAPDDQVFRITIEAFREADAQNDQELVSDMLDAYRSGGLGTVGLQSVRAALELGQVDRLLVPAVPAASVADERSSGVESAGAKEQRGRIDEKTVEELVTMARRTDAAVRFIEEARLLEPAQGVGAMLRYRVQKNNG